MFNIKLFIKLSVLDQSAQSSKLGGRISAFAVGRSARLLGQVGGP